MAGGGKCYAGSDMCCIEGAVFPGCRLTFKFLPFYVVESETLFSIDAGHWYIWKVCDGGGEGIRIITLPSFPAWGLSYRK